MASDDLEKYAVVRIADEIEVDLMPNACGISYEEASRMIDEVEIDGTRIPFASAPSPASWPVEARRSSEGLSPPP